MIILKPRVLQLSELFIEVGIILVLISFGIRWYHWQMWAVVTLIVLHSILISLRTIRGLYGKR